MTVYECPKCRQRVELAITPCCPPTCSCRPRKAATNMVPVQKVDA
jgi:hypothetical protein